MSMRTLLSKIVIFIVTILLLLPVRLFAEEKIMSLSECIKEAEKNNPELKAQGAKVEEYGFKYRQQLGVILPQLDANISYTRYEEQLPSKKTLFGSSLDDYYSDISLRQVLFSGGKNISQINSASTALSAEKQKFEQIRKTVHLSVKKAYFEQARAQYMFQIQQELLARLMEHLTIAQLLYESGKISNVDVLKIKTQLAAAEDSLSNLKDLVYTKALLLGQTMGLNEAVNASLQLAKPEEGLTIKSVCLENKFKDTPEIKYDYNLIEKANFDKLAAKGELFPNVSLRASYFREDKDFFPEYPNWYAGIAITVPLFHGGSIISQIQQAKARQKQAQESLIQTELNLNVKFQSAKASLVDRINRLKTTKKVLDLAQESLTATELSYKSGKLSALELIDAQTVYYNSLLNYKNNIIDYYIAKAEIEYICPEAIAEVE